MAEAVLRIENLAKNFGGLRVTDDVTLDVHAGRTARRDRTERRRQDHADQPDLRTARARRRPHRVRRRGRDGACRSTARAQRGLARSFQITSILPRFSVLENVALAVQARSGSSFRFFGRAADEEALNDAGAAALAQVGLAERADVPAGELSHGEKRALELAIALAMEPKLLLLDEPMAGTGRDETERLVAALRGLKGRFPMVLVEHDMHAVFALADRISVLIYGRILASGTPAQVRADPQVITAYLGEEME